MGAFTIFTLFRRFDEFGHPIGLNYAKNDSHNTWCGIIVSLTKAALLLTFFTHILMICIQRRDPKI